MHRYLDFFGKTDIEILLVQLVLVVLLLLSIYSWALLLKKIFELKQIRKGIKTFASSLEMWGGSSLEELVSLLKDKKNIVYQEAVERLLDNYPYLSSLPVADRQGVLEQIFVPIFRAPTRLETGVGVFATIGSSAPFIGLFGTVVGIIESFSAIEHMESVALNVVAPGIAGALFTTAFGLFVAVPAVFMYNFFLAKTSEVQQQQDELLHSLIFTTFYRLK